MSAENVPDLMESSSGGEEEEDESEWNEVESSTNGLEQSTTCLFCPSQFRTLAVALDHCRLEHKFDLLDMKLKHRMDCYSYIKMVNFIRAHNIDSETLLKCETPVWSDETYLKPVNVEPWLMFDFDDLGSEPSTPYNEQQHSEAYLNKCLRQTIQDLSNQLHEKDVFLQNALQDMTTMKEVAKNLLQAGLPDVPAPKATASSLSADQDTGYFSSYSHFGIHLTMLSDKVRTQSYRDAIMENSEKFMGKTVLDLGCGTGILSMFCAKAGAKKVYAVDQSDIIYQAMGIVRENKLEDTIELIKGKIEEIELPVDAVDVIVSEWMGYFLLFEGMLDSVVFARDRYLKPGGLLLPNRFTINIVGIDDQEKYRDCISFWDDVYGFSMKCMKSEVVHEGSIEPVRADSVVTNSAQLTEIMAEICTTDCVNFQWDFTLSVQSDGKLTAIVGYFDTFFDLPHAVSFSTSPHADSTHWKQTVFHLKEPISVETGNQLQGNFSCKRQLKDVRSLSICITLNNVKHNYALN